MGLGRSSRTLVASTRPGPPAQSRRTQRELRESEVLGVIGSNALGKTTFAKILASGQSSVRISYKPQYISSDFDGSVIELLETVVDNPHSDEYKSEIIRPLGVERLMENKIKKHVDNILGPIARPSKVYFVKDLPKTRSGKIMRRILKSILANEEPAGLMTLVNPECVEEIKTLLNQNIKNEK